MIDLGEMVSRDSFESHKSSLFCQMGIDPQASQKRSFSGDHSLKSLSSNVLQPNVVRLRLRSQWAFIQGEKEDQEIAEACRRLIKNAIVCWNYLYLSRILAEEKNEARKAMLIEAIRNGSAATWAHFNLHGEFDFSDERMVDLMGLTSPKKTG